MATHALKLCSYNSRGHRTDKVSYMAELLKDCDILCVQEHWYLQEDIHLLSSDPDTLVAGVSGMDSAELVQGRPFGGCAFLYKRSWNCTLKMLSARSRRICSCIITMHSNVQMLIFNLYMPTDEPCNATEYQEVLCEVESMITGQCDADVVIVCGDLNTDLSRHASSHSRALTEFCGRLPLSLCVNSPVSNVSHTYVNYATGSKSLIDHFIVSDNVVEGMTRYESCFSGINLSDHLPLMIELKIDSAFCPDTVGMPANPHTKLAWHRAKDDDKARYQICLKELLSNTDPPVAALECRTFGCDVHVDQLRSYHDRIIEAVALAGERCIPKIQPSRAKAGWSELVAPAQEKAKFWHRMWISGGGERQGWVHALMLKTRAEYKRVSRWVIRNQQQLQADRMAGHLANNRSRDLWEETRRLRRTRSCHPNVIDGAVGEDEICRLFHERYSDLYQSVPTDQVEIARLHDVLSQGSSRSCCRGLCYCDHAVNRADVKAAVRKLKASKADVDPRLSSDNFLHACEELFVHLSLLLNALVFHPDAGSVLSKAFLIPIPKSLKKSLNHCDNYRSIAISSIVGKVLDNVIMSKHSDALKSDDLQFGFKKAHSTTQCTYVLSEVVDHYTRGGSNVFVSLLDASRAFDRVHYGKLFQQLVDRKMCFATIKLLLTMYTGQCLAVQWLHTMSPTFECKNGVKQGGVLSPILFCVVIDVLLRRLRDCGAGCYLGSTFVGALAYADDVSIIAPTFSSCQKMLDVSFQFAEEFHLLFNSTKSQAVVFGRSETPRRHLELNGAPIPYVAHADHLGHVIGDDAARRNVQRAASNLTVRANMLSMNYSFVHFEHLRVLFNTYCSSYYGSQFWSLDDMELLSVSWRKSVRRVFSLNARTHSRYLPHLVEMSTPFATCMERIVSLYTSLCKSTNAVVRACFQHSRTGRSVFDENLRCIMARSKLNYDSIECMAIDGELRKRVDGLRDSISDEDFAIVFAIKELICCKYYRHLTFPFTQNDFDVFLTCLCTM